jgi:chemotaxis protein MotB
MAASANTRPIIIKRKKIVQGGGHHGGAWKVAYADFVTAMMAFFLLMWLLNATTEKQRKGIADFFNPTIPINRISGGGDGAFGGDSMFAEDQIARTGTGASAMTPTAERQARGNTGVTPGSTEGKDSFGNEGLTAIQEMLMGASGESMVANELLRHIQTRVTDEGLIVEMFDLDDAPLFDAAEGPTPILSALVEMLARVFALVSNDIAVAGHIRAQPEVMIRNPAWDLSTARAQTARRMLEQAGLDALRVERVTGWADRKPVDDNPMAVRNNRLELVLLRTDR